MDEPAGQMNQEESNALQTEVEGQVSHMEGIATQVEGDLVHFGPGFALSVSASQDAHVEQAGAIGIAAGRDMHIAFGGGMGLAVGHDLEVENGGGAYLRVGGNARLDNSLALASVSQQVAADQSMLGIVLARQVNLGEGNRVLINTPQALAMGAMIGVVFGLVSWFFRRK